MLPLLAFPRMVPPVPPAYTNVNSMVNALDVENRLPRLGTWEVAGAAERRRAGSVERRLRGVLTVQLPFS